MHESLDLREIGCERKIQYSGESEKIQEFEFWEVCAMKKVVKIVKEMLDGN